MQYFIRQQLPIRNFSPILVWASAPFFRVNQQKLYPLILLLGAYIFFGLTGHDPWKADEAYIFGVIHSMLKEGSWLVPLVAGEPFMEKPPLYAWLAAGMVRLLHGWVSEPDAARLASGVFMAVALWSVASATRRWWVEGVGRYAPVILCACLGILVQAHMMMPDLPLLAGISLALWGLSFILERSLVGGALIGLGTGMSFLAKGLFGPCVIVFTIALLPSLFVQWRTKNYFSGLVVTFSVALPLLIIWPTLLYEKSLTLFSSWFWDNNFGRFFGTAEVARGTEASTWFWWTTLPWFAFPALPLAIHVLYAKRKSLFTHPGIQCTTIMSLVVMLILSFSASARAVYAFPLIAPLAILAAPSALTINKIIDRIWIWTSAIIFLTLSAGIWVIWLIMMTYGTTPKWRWISQLLPSSFIPHFDLATVIIAAVLTLIAIVSLKKTAQTPRGGLISWVIGMTLVWTLMSTLMMPWLDCGKSYRTVFQSIPWPITHHCVASVGLGEGERAMLDYYDDRLTLRRELSVGSNCDVLLVQGYTTVGVASVNHDKWRLIWSGARPGDAWQKFWLYKAKL